jgi:hypothetical protein
MSNTIRIRRRADGGGAGAPSSLANAELAFNEQTNILYYGTGLSGGNAAQIIAIGGDGAFATKTYVDNAVNNVDVSGQLANYALLSGAAFSGNVSISGNLTVTGTTTTLNTTELSVDDINIVLGDTASPSDASADGGGITLKGTTDKTFNWVDATDAWTSSEHLNLASGKKFYINGTEVLSATALGSGISVDGGTY